MKPHMSKEEMIRIVDSQLVEYNHKNLDAFCRHYHPEVVVIQLLTGKTMCNGLIELRSRYRARFESAENLVCHIKTRIALDSIVIDEEVVMGLRDHPNGLHTAAIYGFRDHLISHVWLVE